MKGNLTKRKNIRLKDYDYSNEGIYFITICIKERKELLGQIKKEENIELSKEGKIVGEAIHKLKEAYSNIEIDEYVIMPNHIHLIIIINGKNKITISRIIQQFKWGITRKLGFSIFQKLFYEHIIRNEKEYCEIKEYIQNNIINWGKDKYF